MFVRWLTSAQLGSSITNQGNEFESHHIRNLPRLKWNMRTQTCNKSYQVMPVSLLRKGAWVHPDFRDASILWHIKSTQFYMHQDPEQAMGTIAGGNKQFTLINQSQFAFKCSNTQMQKRIVDCVSKIVSCGKKKLLCAWCQVTILTSGGVVCFARGCGGLHCICKAVLRHTYRNALVLLKTPQKGPF